MPKLVDYTSHIKIDEKMLIKGTLEYEALVLDSRNGDNLSITINDDLSGLISFTALALGRARVL